LKGILSRIFENEARTDPEASDPRLRGRTYAIPFEDVWQASISLCGGGLRRWTLTGADDQSGVIEAATRSVILGIEDDVRVQIVLDYNAQTRVDMQAVSRVDRGDLGRTRRAIGRFFRRLDRRLKADPNQILATKRLGVGQEES
jgi:hypothetical protein